MRFVAHNQVTFSEVKMKRLVIACMFILSSNFALAHSGGTDANGCHAGTKPYHCHNKK